MAARIFRSVASVAGQAQSRSFAAKAAPEADIVGTIFKQQQQKFRALLAETDKLQLPLSGEPAEVKAYVASMDKIKTKVGIPPVQKRMESAIKFTYGIAPDMRSFLQAESALRADMGVPDTLGTEEKLAAALDKVEKSIGGPLLKTDAKGMAAFKKEVAAIEKSLALPSMAKIEEGFKLEEATAMVEDIKNKAIQDMEMAKRRDGLEFITIDPASIKV
ncbi:hypothetical protein CYMTET_47653 [Cymbomonas tetramitiformis]|uniref:Uncharacterized protein n=1 Tax=Cymbomonas tetramitiformis TaxID=36881 RepID=A0AAE0BVR2_9CHLO|nr:hypothetical protein CYMTET_47653 [Cymbomonas tetramitiformis]|eukprot:gene17847-21252_t